MSSEEAPEAGLEAGGAMSVAIDALSLGGARERATSSDVAGSAEGATLAERLAQQPTGFHLFETVTFATMHWCFICRGLCWGLKGQGQKCVICAAVVHHKCAKKLRSVRSCRRSYMSAEEAATAGRGHHWTPGNVTMKSRCHECSRSMQHSTSLGDSSRCAWCSLKAHHECIERIPRVCDSSKLFRSVIMPWQVRVSLREGCEARHEDVSLEARSALHFEFDLLPTQAPLLCFVNSRSGGQQGGAIFGGLLRYLNELQVRDLGVDGGPHLGLRLFKDVPNLRVVACGGDGTFGWINNAIDEVGFETRPPVFPLAAGTGNDMAISLGFGSGYMGGPIKTVLKSFQRGEVGLLDRWTITFDGKAHGYQPIMYNYFEVGVNAKVAHRFHQERESHPERFNSRFVNKVKYATWGAFDSIRLAGKIELYCDNQQLDIPSNAQAITVLNLPTYSGGMKLWSGKEGSSDHFGLGSFNDGVLEVVCLKGTQDIALSMVGVKPVRLSQPREIRIIIKQCLPVHIDGEPFMQEPCQILITHNGVVPVGVNTQKMLVSTQSVEAPTVGREYHSDEEDYIISPRLRRNSCAESTRPRLSEIFNDPPPPSNKDDF